MVKYCLENQRTCTLLPPIVAGNYPKLSGIGY